MVELKGGKISPIAAATAGPSHHSYEAFLARYRTASLADVALMVIVQIAILAGSAAETCLTPLKWPAADFASGI